MDLIGNILISIIFCTLFGFAVFGTFGVTVQMWALGTLLVAFLVGMLGLGG